MGFVADKVYALDITKYGAGVAWMGAVCYVFQIYFDFSGYCDMAIGLARVFGFEFLENFDHPYSSALHKRILEQMAHLSFDMV